MREDEDEGNRAEAAEVRIEWAFSFPRLTAKNVPPKIYA